MANRRQSLINLSLLPGHWPPLLITVALISFGALWFLHLKCQWLTLLAIAICGM